ncbi:ras-domain-containing protein [Clavulina sp. PMI_390]|nr:ras-domain-containing protein [Clavulina sp. PMI_390]
MDYPYEHDYGVARNQRLAVPRPSIVTSRTNYSSISDGLDAKVVVMGNSAVGKTSLVQRFTENKFSLGSTMSTTGAFFVTKKVIVDGLKVRLQLWDTAGQERFRSMAPMYYRGANAAILCYDITDASSFDDVRKWLDELKHYQRPGSAHSGDEDEQPPLLIYVVGAKADLSSTKRAISLVQARRLLHTWYPGESNTRPSTPPPAPSSKLSTITTASGFSYIRPRFTSLTTSLSVPVPVPAVASSSSSRSSPPTPPRHGPPPPPLTRTRASNSSPPQSSSASSRSAALSRTKSARVVPVGTPLFGEDRTRRRPGDEQYSAAELDEEWPLEKGMALFEVSARDGTGIQELFDDLLANIIERKETIQRERALRERNSVLLDSTPGSALSLKSGSPANGTSKSDLGGASSTGRSGWSCCAS